MPYDPNDDTIIRHGTLQQWLGYKVYSVVKGQWFVALAFLLGAVAGRVL